MQVRVLGRWHKRTVIVARAKRSFARAGAATVRLRLTSVGRMLLRRLRAPRLVVRLYFVDSKSRRFRARRAVVARR
jgi:hypothetical protein